MMMRRTGPAAAAAWTAKRPSTPIDADARSEEHEAERPFRAGRDGAPCLLAPLAAAQDAYPTKPITLIVPQAAGGANDTIARIYAQKLSEHLGQQVVIENKVGAGGNIGTVAAAKAPKDGYTLLLTVNSAHLINYYLYKNAGFDPLKDFEPITPVATAGYVLVAEPAFPGKNVKDLIAYAKANPGMSYASAGNGTLNHLLAEMLKVQTGIEMQHVPYKSAAASVADVVGGRVPVSFQSVPSAPWRSSNPASSKSLAWRTRSAWPAPARRADDRRDDSRLRFDAVVRPFRARRGRRRR